LFSFIILIIVFIFRIPFGLFLVSLTLFKIIGHFLDPIFDKTGYLILTSFAPFWEFIYNLPLMRWSGFNNTIVMGSLVWGIVVGSFLYIILNKFIKIYREKVFSFLKRYKLLKWLVPEIGKGKIFRISGIVLLVTLLVGISLIIMLLFDPILKKAIEISLSNLFNKPVKIETINTSFLDAKIDINNLYIDTIKTEKIQAKLSWDYLVWKKFDIEYLYIKNIRSDKSIEDIIALVYKNNKTSSKKVNSVNSFNLQLPKPENILINYKLESLEKIDKLQKDYQFFLKEANNIKSLKQTYQEKINLIKKEIQNLKVEIENINSFRDINNILAKVEKIKENIINIKTEVKKNKNKILNLKNRILKDLKEIKLASKKDYEKISNAYNIIKNKEYMKFTEFMLKPEISKYVEAFFKYYDLIKPYLFKKEEKEYVRKKGTYIKYKDKIKYPDFVLQKGIMSGSLKNANIGIKMNNISSDQKLLNKPALIDIISNSQYYKKITMKISYLNKIKYNLNADNIILNEINLNKLDILNPKIDIFSKGMIYNQQFDININSYIFPKKMIFSIDKYISNVLKSIKKITFSILIKGDYKKYYIIINSNLDSLLSQYIYKELNKKASKYKKELKLLIDKKIEKELGKIGIKNINDFNINNLYLSNSLNSIQNNLEKITKKELKKKLLNKGVKIFLDFK
ncbi:MAG TPA: TIGR03545 family protein, partial [Nautiliaceae bacterium]|nr:TIGR03545 family protein [Nautiliaceae bacterium]